jgi:asparagine synthase (glutamine-hydrolysing)
MCGINGFTFQDPELLSAMNSRLAHRGPDDEGSFCTPAVSLGHRRLSIIDLSADGHQPMFSADKRFSIVFNGEIYNYIELREELKGLGATFRTKTDTEVILIGYQYWGEDCLHKFNGMWSFCIYDQEKQLLFLARDRFGVKPLYYAEREGQLFFSSEIKALLVHRQKLIPEVNERALFDYISFNAVDYGRETFFKGIYRLEPGQKMNFDLRTRVLDIHDYYQFPEASGGDGAKAEELKELFLQSVQLRLRSDVPVGASLSGGIDSSTIASVIAKKFATTAKLETFSIVFPGSKVDESTYVQTVLNETGASSKRAVPAFEQFMSDLDDFIYFQEEPVRTTSMYAHYTLMREVKEKGVVVLLEGQGADELFGGYVPWMTFQVLVHHLKRFSFGQWMRELLCASTLYGTSPLRLVTGFVQHALIGSLAVKKAYFALNRTVLSKDFFNRWRHKSIVFGLSTPESIKASLRGRFHLGLAALLRYGDKNSMRFSIESRFPFLDYRLVEYVFSKFSVHDYLSSGVTKKLFREAMAGITPARILNRHDKIGFETPQDEWFRTKEFQELFREVLASPQFKARPYWNHARVRNVFDAHCGGQVNHSTELWRILNVELWIRRFIDRA